MFIVQWLAWSYLAHANCDQTDPSPDPLVLTVVEDRLVPGGTLTLEAAGVAVGTPVRFAMGSQTGRDPCPAALGGSCLGLERVRYLGLAEVGADGVARLTVPVPEDASLHGLSVQAVALSCDAPALSEVVERVVESDAACAIEPNHWLASCTDSDVACWRDGWFASTFDDGVDTSRGLVTQAELPDWFDASSSVEAQQLALELSLAFDQAGAMGARDLLGNQVVPQGTYAGQTLADIVAMPDPIAPEDLEPLLAWVFDTFACDASVLEPADPVLVDDDEDDDDGGVGDTAEPGDEDLDDGPLGCVTDGDGDLFVDGELVVNRYFAPADALRTLEAGDVGLPLAAHQGASGAIEAGDRLLVIQMQGVEIDAGEGSTFDDAYGDGPTGADRSGYLPGTLSAGTWELVVATGPADADGVVPIEGIGNGGGLQHAYISNDLVQDGRGWHRWQVVRVPQFANLTLSEGGRIVPASWDGTTGGVVAVDVAGTLTFDGGSIDASGMGFRGGKTETLNQNGAGQLGAPGHKGEGVAGPPRHMYDELPGPVRGAAGGRRADWPRRRQWGTGPTEAATRACRMTRPAVAAAMPATAAWEGPAGTTIRAATTPAKVGAGCTPRTWGPIT